jgi:anthranilate synthase component 2
VLTLSGEAFEVEVVRNDAITVAEVGVRGYDRIIISPGPGSPDNPDYFGVCAEVIAGVGRTSPVLGVCLGMQGIACGFGGKVTRAAVPMHGKTSRIRHSGSGLFRGLPQEMEVMRYHSLAVVAESLPPEVVVTATADDGTVMGLAHTQYPIAGIQFHPESFASEGGDVIVRNFLEGVNL